MKKLYCVLFLLFLSACTIDNGHYDILAPKNVNLYNFYSPSVLVKKDVQETVSLSVLATFIPFGRQPTIEDVMNEMLKKYKGDYLQNVKIEYNTFKLLIYYDYRSWTITADVMRFR